MVTNIQWPLVTLLVTEVTIIILTRTTQIWGGLLQHHFTDDGGEVLIFTLQLDLDE
jgi:hypothetical protein